MRRSAMHMLAALMIGALAIPMATADADGLPRLDPTNSLPGILYDVLIAGKMFSMGTGPQSRDFSYLGTLLIMQDIASAELDGELVLDTDRDGTPDRLLDCDGYVGRGRFGVRCSDDDGLGDLRVIATGRALVLDNGRLALRKAQGRAFSENETFTFGLRATQQ
ncbi:MAG TPA: hypothetical protein VFP98_00125 [Candidatus Polarisedimenticolia bacterium]|nr:hypothetical protein [Candidatus Polarisedimenticolia bacterium]